MGDEARIPGDITVLLRRWESGDREALETLAEAAYSELRRIASSYLQRERPGHTLQTTGLINELYLRLARQRSAHFSDRRHFFTFSALMMRRILRDYAREAGAQRPSVRVPLSPEMDWVDAAGEEMIALDAALDELAALDERKAQVIDLRYFAGCTNQEVADLLGVARATVDRDLQFARSWLHRRLRPE